jgi:hypothetical protein
MKDKDMYYKLFLDDIRNPNDLYPNQEWVVARNLQEFRDIIIECGVPSEISFDHDLGIVDGVVEEATEALTWLIYHENNYIVATIRIHSDNIAGSLNLESKAKTWHKVLIMYGLMKECESNVIRISALQIKRHL